jgi:ABC-type cobalamin transport system ATPase subunit
MMIRNFFDAFQVCASTCIHFSVDHTVENGLAILVALHDLNLTSFYADRVAVLAGGELKAVGTPEQVFVEEKLCPIYGSHLQVITHPEYGTPLVLPAGPDAQFTPRGRGYMIETSNPARAHAYA